ncbi:MULTISPECIES: TolC family protein [Wolbachia]|uniref:TolC family protein n=1 Tax=Wolbachia TaxID=953 RepID=UPI000023B8A5|nr:MULTISPECIES: TolC family protein [Wolbachia]MDU8941060.1 TolC family protein [Wolbachia endosymbiont of Drosophila malagassya]MDX5496134.1 TolC family protein [Wolbachia endosymbiont of Nomada fabriciana]MDX5508032.1 TolC family protein [Wolbachia endosymbiont of Hylaeus sinuatus]MDX5518692.1 TolC family protein [Wolbachia endosymbiont of Andrena agilissima]MDX5527405.1 TolC family protein [Wolbachia endosymbiont of Andrena nigroaenea]MDX5528455.1 TolC family protein [Wolbachia endosymbio
MFRLIITLAIIFNTISCYATDVGEVISKAIKNSSKIKSQFYQYKSAEKHYKSSGLAGFLPDINLQYNFDSNFNLDTSEKKLTLRQKLIDGGGTFATFSRSSHLLKAEKMRFQQLKQELALNAVKAYVNVLQKTEILKLREHKERVSLEHLSAMKKRFSLGEVTNAEVLLAKAKFSSSISERVDAEGKLKLVNIAYYHLIGEDADDLSEANDKLPSVPELNECLQLAKTNNLSLKAAVYQKRAAGMEVIAESSKWLPSLNLSASKNFGEDGMKVDKLLENVHVVFTLDVPIFKRGVNAFGVSKAKMDAKKSTYDYYETVKNIEQAVVNAWNNVLTAKAIIKASQEAEKAAALALEGVEQEVNLNLKSTSDLLDTEDALFKARSDLVEAKSNYVISVYNLLFMINSINL